VAFRGRGGLLARAFAYSAGLQTMVVLNGWLLARAVGVVIPLAAFFVLVPLAVFVMTLPVAINGIGVREAVWAFFFAAYGVSSAAALGVAVAWLDVGLLLLQALAGGGVWALRRGELHRAGTIGVAGEARAARNLSAGTGVEPAAEGTR
jgi:glycosyltransferase 2 family protein